MGNITLTKTLFALLIATFTVTMLFTVYSDFVFLNNATIEEKYSSAFQDISSEYSNFQGISETASDQGRIENILDFGGNAITGTFNVFVLGLKAIGSFFLMITFIDSILSILKITFPLLKELIGLASILMTLYIGMRYIQSTTNKSDLP